MPQETNLNVAPYFDDFDPQSNYYKVLFKPAHPVQARELNNLQSILQNQIEDMGNHFFKEGAKVIPGQLTYLPEFYAIQIEPEFLGIPVDLYLQQMVGKKITGASSGVTGEVVTYITDQESENGNFTLYINYYESSTSNNSTKTFFDNEVLLTGDNITFATTFIAAGEGFAKTLTQNANAVGSAFALSNGVYFLRGYFVDVEDQILILDQYDNTPNYRVGLNVVENLISSDLDPSLNDNAKNFTNFTAPGADRLEIVATLAKRDGSSGNDQNFVQLAEVQNGILREINQGTEYNILGEELAQRTFDESGHYYVKPFTTTVKESLNNGIGNRGVYNPNQTTTSGKKPSEDLMVYKISPGKAYVRGYPVRTIGPTFLDVEKPRTTKNIKQQSVNFSFGPTFSVNNVNGAPTLGFDSTNTVSLRDQRIGAASTAKSGKEIGIARVYDFALETGSYEISQLQLNQWDLSLFDVQTYNEFELNEETTLTIPTFIEGESSGAKGYLRFPVSAGTALTAYNTQGTFSLGERLKFNGESTGQRTVIDSTKYDISDIQSVYSIVGSAGTFTADLIPKSHSTIGIASISKIDPTSGVSTVRSPGLTFPGIVTTGNLVRYTSPDETFPVLNRVTSVNTEFFTIEQVEDVLGFVDGDLPTSDLLNVTDLEIVKSEIEEGSAQNADLPNNRSLYSVLPKRYIQNVDLSDSSLVIRKQFDVTLADNSTGVINSDPGEVFLPFDEERYSLVNDAGSLEVLSSDRFTFSAGNTQVTISGLSAATGAAKLQATLRKATITPKIKTKKVVNTVVVDKSVNQGSGIGATTLNNGLTYGDFPFGTRVEDKEICLNVPDVIMVYGVFQGQGSADATAPSMVLGSMDGPSNTTNDLVIGEEVIGSISGSRAMYVTRLTDTNIEFIHRNNTPFEPGEVINFQESGVSAVATNITQGSRNIISSFRFENGQKDSIYDYSKLLRRNDAPIPSNKLKIYFMSADYNSSDTGDITVCNSYNDFNYNTDISHVNGFRNTEIVDGRPRVSPYNVTTGVRSPFEFLGRSFNGGQHSSKDILASDESMTISYDYYLGRKDVIYLDKDGIFSVRKGAPADDPTDPKGIEGAMAVATVALTPYTLSASDSTVVSIDYKRYQMSDIAKLEMRIKNLEYYTSLNQLESSTLNSFVPDSNGLNRFKSGIFVDNFTDLSPQDLSIGAKNSVDRDEGVLRPSHYTTAFNMQVGNTTMPGVGNDSNQDARFANILGQNTRRTGDMITLDYNEVSWLDQLFGTRTESVTPFFVRFWQGRVGFRPTVDVWIDVNQRDTPVNTMMEGSFKGVAQAMKAEITTNADGSRSGQSPIIWKAWETTGVDVSFSLGSSQTHDKIKSERAGNWEEFYNFRTADGKSLHSHTKESGVPGSFKVDEIIDTTTTTITGSVGIDLSQVRRGTSRKVTEQIDTASLGNRITSRDVINFMRSRNIEFTAKSMKPFTQVYAFFDSVDVNKFVMPKLLEITMTSGTFVVGETVTGTMPSTTTSTGTQTDEDQDNTNVASITFRVANADHKFGPYNNPTQVFVANPYDRRNDLPVSYTEGTSILNIDTASLASDSDDGKSFFGFIANGMVLKGGSSGAEATVRDLRLVTDRVGTLIGSYRVPDSSNDSNPTFETGNNVFRLTSSETNSTVEGVVSTSAEDNFYSQGDTDNTEERTLSLRNALVEHNDAHRDVRTLDADASDSTSFTTQGPARTTGEYKDPLAQSFTVPDPTGVYLTGLDLYFSEKPTEFDVPVTVQIREVELGVPNQIILPFSNVTLDPDDINLSDDASVATRFNFESPVYLNGLREYAIIIISVSTEYRVWISRLGEVDVQTLDNVESDQILVTTQTLLGSLFKSQNASTWTPSQYEDLKFELYRADFVPSGSVQLFNPGLDPELEIIPPNGLDSHSRTIRVGLGTTSIDTDLEPGNLIFQSQTNAQGRFVGYGGSAAQMTLNIINSGIGYTPSSGELEYTGIALTSLSGHGANAEASFFIKNGVATGATITVGGKGYQVGDVLAPISLGTGLGDGVKVSISTIFGSNELTITDVQGTFGTAVGDKLNYTKSTGVSTVFNFDQAGEDGVVPVSPIVVVNTGDHITVRQRNHGMYSNTNVVRLRDVGSTVVPTTLSSAYSNTDTGPISVASTANFTTFESMAVSATNPGYVVMNSEVLAYTGFSGNTLTGITRGVDDTNVINHTADEILSKYEFNGVSLRRINKTHFMNEVTEENPFDTDFYKLKIDFSKNGLDRTTATHPKLYFNSTSSGGGRNAKGSYNLPFSQAVPRIITVAPTGTSLTSTMRTISATSISGNEGSFVDQGFEQVALQQTNYFNTQRMVASPINEETFLDDLPANKSLSMSINMTSADSRVSPGIDLDNMGIVLTSNRVNESVTDFANDPRVDTVIDDPNKFMYVTKLVRLANPATSLQVVVDAFLTEDSDLRMLFAIDQEGRTSEAIFTPFPGSNNTASNGSVASPANNDGKPDGKYVKSDGFTQTPTRTDYKEYKYSIDNLPPFTSFRIKLVGTSVNQASPPMVRNFRALGLA